MNRKQRRDLMKYARKSGLNKTQAKEYSNQFIGDKFQVGQKCKLNYEFIIRQSNFNSQSEDFKEWIRSNKGNILTVESITDGGWYCTFEEDTHEPKWKCSMPTLLPVPTATIKLEDGTEKKIVLDDNITDVNDPKIMEAVNAEMNKEEE